MNITKAIKKNAVTIATSAIVSAATSVAVWYFVTHVKKNCPTCGAWVQVFDKTCPYCGASTG